MLPKQQSFHLTGVERQRRRDVGRATSALSVVSMATCAHATMLTLLAQQPGAVVSTSPSSLSVCQCVDS